MTNGELIKELEKYEPNATVKIEIYNSEKDFDWYLSVRSVYEIKNPYIKKQQIIIETND
jgi:hypothetical protein